MIPFWTAGGTIDLAALRPQDLTAETMAGSLAQLNRFSGRGHEPWSVAAHSVLVERLCTPGLGPWALLHDAHEMIIGDITTPAVELIAHLGDIPEFDAALSRAKGRIDLTIASAWKVPVRSMSATIKRADRIALCAEAIWFLGGAIQHLEPNDAEDIDRALQLLSEMAGASDWRRARDLWLSRIEHYAEAGAMSPPPAQDPTGAVPAG